MEVREVLVIIGVVLIAVILWDGLRRMKSKKANRYRGGYTQDPEELKKKAEIARELPNGGARVRTMTEEDKQDLTSRLNLRERVPMLMDSVEEAARTENPEPKPESVEQQSLDFEAPPAPAEADEPASDTEPTGEESWSSTEREPAEDHYHFSARDDDDFVDSESETEPDPEPEPEAREAAGAETERHESRPGPEAAETESAEAESAAEDSPERESDDVFQNDPRPVEELVIMHVMAREGEEISGSDLLETLLRAGLRFGPLDIFHYRNPRGQLEFSLANCVQPGTLDPDTMEQLTTPGITLFMQLPQHADMMESFDHMYEMARFLAKHLGAELLDEELSTVTPQTAEHYRERLRDFARSQLIQAHE